MSNIRPTILIPHAAGTNRDAEAARACELAGGRPAIVHINQLRDGALRFVDYDMLLLPGGFSYGDALGAGVRLALDLQVFFQDQLHAFVARGKPVLGICNGFQALVKAGIFTTTAIPALAEPPPRPITLTENASGRFECRWVYLAIDRSSTATWLHDLDELIFCPVAHGEGNFQVRDEETLTALAQSGQVLLRYVAADGQPVNGAYPLNPNGSVADIAGICNQRGTVVGLMPHPEDHVVRIQNPLGRSGQMGLQLFQAMISMV